MDFIEALTKGSNAVEVLLLLEIASFLAGPCGQ